MIVDGWEALIGGMWARGRMFVHCATIVCEGMVVVSCGSGNNVVSIVFGRCAAIMFEGAVWSFCGAGTIGGAIIFDEEVLSWRIGMMVGVIGDCMLMHEGS